MNIKKRNLIFWVIFILVFSLMLVIATLYDYQISNILADMEGSRDNYYSTNLFGRILETFGECIIYVMIAFAATVIAMNILKVENKFIKISCSTLFFIISILFLYIGFNKIAKYSMQHHPQWIFFDTIWYTIISITCSIIIIAGLFLYLNKKANVRELLSFSIIILITAALSQGIVQGLKPLFGRERFRAIYYFNENNLNHNGFTPWYVMNGDSSKLAALYNVDKDFFKSFPSGHTSAAGMIYTLILIPEMFNKYNNRKSKILFLILSIAYTGLVAISRIIMGAHYFSDVLIGGSISFISVIAAYYIYVAIHKKIVSKNNKINN